MCLSNFHSKKLYLRLIWITPLNLNYYVNLYKIHQMSVYTGIYFYQSAHKNTNSTENGSKLLCKRHKIYIIHVAGALHSPENSCEYKADFLHFSLSGNSLLILHPASCHRVILMSSKIGIWYCKKCTDLRLFLHYCKKWMVF